MKHLPNLLTAARLALTPYLFWLMVRHQYRTIIPWFIVIGVTDAVDGFLARRFHASSRLGAYLDPLADKVLLSGTFLVLALTGSLVRVWGQQADQTPYPGAPATRLDFYVGQALQNSPLLKDLHNQALSGEVDSQLIKASYLPQVVGSPTMS